MRIDEYYNQTIELNRTEKAGWATCYYGVFSKVIEENNYKKILEIGVGYGCHAEYILKNNKNIDKLILVDPMTVYHDNPFQSDIMRQEKFEGINNYDKLFELINNSLSPYSDKYVWLRKKSSEVTDEEIPDGSLDAIFVDGDHSQEAVYEDLNKYWNKLVSGGQMLGDDYWMEEVSSAVKKFSKNIGVEYDFLYKPGTDYKIYRFKKA